NNENNNDNSTMSSVSISLTSESISSDVPSKIQRGVTMSADEKANLLILKKAVSFHDASGTFVVESGSSNQNVYIVDLKKFPIFTCTCPNHNKKVYCHHIIAVMKKLRMPIRNPKTAVKSGQLRKNRRRAAGIGVPGRKTPTTMDKQNKDETIKAPRPVRKRKSSIPKITPDEKITKDLPLSTITNTCTTNKITTTPLILPIHQTYQSLKQQNAILPIPITTSMKIVRLVSPTITTTGTTTTTPLRFTLMPQ
ncbi:unnamed protein product, partial [Didymodactylos carnosus]